MFRKILFHTLAVGLIATALPIRAQETGAARGIALFEEQARFDYCTTTTEVCPFGSIRTLRVFRANTGGTGARNTYYLEPALLPIAWESPSDGWPSAFRYVERTIGGQISYSLEVRILSFGAELQELAEIAVRASPTEAGFVEGGTTASTLDLNDIIVYPLEMQEARLEIISLPENEVLATSMQLLGNAGAARIWEFSVPIPAVNRELQGRLSRGEFAFRVSYNYVGGQPPRRASITAIDQNTLRQNYSDVLESFQIEQGEPISQAERESITIAMRQAVIASVSGNDLDTVSLLLGRDFLSRLDGDLFQGRDILSLDEFRERRGLESVEAFLEPLYSDLRELNREQSSDTQSTETRERRGFDVRIPAGGATLGLNMSQEDIQRTGSQRGVEFLVDEEERVLSPHRINVTYVASRRAESVSELAVSIQVEDRTARSFSRGEIIPATMVLTGLEAGVVVPTSTFGIPVGAAICSFALTRDPPRGYRWIAAGNYWPDLPTFGTLAGRAMPNMNSMLMGSTERQSDVGSETFGTLTIPARTLSLNTNSGPHGRIRLSRPTVFVFGSAYTGTLQYNSLVAYREASIASLADGYVVTGGRLSMNSGALRFSQGGLTPSPLFSLAAIRPVTAVSASVELPGYQFRLNSDQLMPRHLRCRWMVREY